MKQVSTDYFLAHCLYVNNVKAEQVLIKVPNTSYTKKNWNNAMRILSEYATSKDKECIYNIETPISIGEYEKLETKIKTIR